jgi:hypothetical protein
MGANAQTSVPTFTTGQVLTAAQQNQINTGVPVFADTTARDAAFGGTGEKVLAEGQLAYIEASNVVQYYDGSTWATLAPASAGALTLISATTIGSAVSSVTVSSAFSSTYDNYLITVSGGVASSNVGLSLVLGSTATGYYRASFYNTYTSATVSGDVQANTTEWTIVGLGTANNLNASVLLFGPNLAKNTVMHFGAAYTNTTGRYWTGGGYLADTTQYTAFTLGGGGGTMTGGTIRVYGYANS